MRWQPAVTSRLGRAEFINQLKGMEALRQLPPGKRDYTQTNVVAGRAAYPLPPHPNLEEIQMTPLITEMVKLVQEPENAHWFDLGVITKHVPAARIEWDEVSRMPYPRICCVSQTTEDGSKFATIVASDRSMVTVSCVSKEQSGKVLRSGTLYIKASEGQMMFQVSGDDPKDEKRIASLLRPLIVVARRIHTDVTAYRPSRKGTTAQQSKRQRSGKAPLFDWNTVTIKPTPDKGECQGGTHASPRLHDRRGHWRKYPSGKVGWVQNCKVGDASKGVVFKDYQIAEH